MVKRRLWTFGGRWRASEFRASTSAVRVILGRDRPRRLNRPPRQRARRHRLCRRRLGGDRPRRGVRSAGALGPRAPGQGPGHRRFRLHARPSPLGRIPRPAEPRCRAPGRASCSTIGGQPFLLAARGGWAWSRGPAQEQAIIAAARTAPAMRVEARDAGGRRFVDPICSAAPRPRSTPRRRAAPCAALAKSAERA